MSKFLFSAFSSRFDGFPGISSLISLDESLLDYNSTFISFFQHSNDETIQKVLENYS